MAAGSRGDGSSGDPIVLRSSGGATVWVTNTQITISGARICAACFECRGELVVRIGGGVHVFDQRCRCRQDESQERWPGFDFNRFVELCRCCGVEPIRSGSRWAVFFCSECFERVLALNRGQGQWLVPIGRHSVMHGVALGGGEADVRERAEQFVTVARGLFDRVGVLDDWSRVHVGAVANQLGFHTDEDIELGEYLLRAREAGFSKVDAFGDLAEHFACRRRQDSVR